MWLSDKLISNVIACCIHFRFFFLSGDSCFAERTEENIGDGYLFHGMFNEIVIENCANKCDSTL